jgi:Mg/Co/Ni transporter MgtE
MGTPEYLAPELLEGQQAGAPSDLWAFGVTLYYALERRSPFYAGNIHATITAILRKDPPEPARRGALADVILAMLSKDPFARPDGKAVAAVLRTVLSGGTPERRPWWYRPDRRERDGRERAAGNGGTQPARGEPRGVQGREPLVLSGMSPAGAAAMINGASTDSGVAVLLQMAEADAARILDRCANHVAGELIGGIAATQPRRAGKILQIVAADRAGRALDYMSDKVAASILAAMSPGEAARIMRECDVRTAGGALAEMPPRTAGQIVAAVGGERAADVLSHVAPVSVAAILNAVPDDLRGNMLQRFSPSFRGLVRRFM